MSNTWKGTLVAAFALAGMASPAIAQPARFAPDPPLYDYAPAPAPYGLVPGGGFGSPFDSNSPAASGGGSWGYNAHNPRDY